VAPALIVSKKQRKLDIQIGLQFDVRRVVYSSQDSLIKPFEHPIRECRGNGELDSSPYTQLQSVTVGFGAGYAERW